MKRVLIAAFLMTATTAFATNNNGNNGEDCNNCYNTPTTNTTNNTTNNQGGSGGNGYGGTAIAGASSAAEAKANAAAIAAQQQGQQQGQAQGQQQSSTSGVKNSGNSSSASGAAVVGSGNSANNNKSSASGNSTSVSVGGDNYERSAPAVIAGNIPSVARSCRLYMFGGATNTSGAVSGSIPLGNDQTCLSGAKLDYIGVANKLFPGSFSKETVVATVCQVEGMNDVAECKAISKK